MIRKIIFGILIMVIFVYYIMFYSNFDENIEIILPMKEKCQDYLDNMSVGQSKCCDVGFTIINGEKKPLKKCRMLI